jgi:hypothetical protein
VIAQFGAVIIALIAFIVSIFAWLLSKRLYRNQIINELYKQYGSTEMGISLNKIWELKRECDKEAKNVESISNAKMVEKYCKKYIEEIAVIEESLHFHRRRVSIFYQNIASIADNDRYYKKFLKQVWKLGDFNTIKVLEPLEMIAVPKCLGSKVYDVDDYYPEYMNSMIKLLDINHNENISIIRNKN